MMVSDWDSDWRTDNLTPANNVSDISPCMSLALSACVLREICLCSTRATRSFSTVVRLMRLCWSDWTLGQPRILRWGRPGSYWLRLRSDHLQCAKSVGILGISSHRLDNCRHGIPTMERCEKMRKERKNSKTYF